jgi:hypothetical protein
MGTVGCILGCKEARTIRLYLLFDSRICLNGIVLKHKIELTENFIFTFIIIIIILSLVSTTGELLDRKVVAPV